MRRLIVVVVALPFMVEGSRTVFVMANKLFDAWFIAQLRKTWRSFDGTLLMR